MAEAAWRRYLRFWRSNVDADVDAELRFHLDERVEALTAEGLPREEARREAEREFGDVDAVRERLRAIDQRVDAHRARANRWEQWRQDFVYSARGLTRTPVVALTVIVTLALGIGVNTTLFSLLDRVFLRMPEGMTAPEELRRLYWVGSSASNGPVAYAPFSIPVADAVTHALDGQASTALYRSDGERFGEEEEKTTVVTSTGAHYFSVLGVRPAFGRFFTPEEERIEVATPVAIVSQRFWARRFGGSPADAIGQQLVVKRQRYTVVGVVPRDFTGVDLDATDVWLPLGTLNATYGRPGKGPPWYTSRGLIAFQLLARPEPGIDQAQLEARATLGAQRGFSGDRWRAKTTILSGPILAARGPEARGQDVAIAIRLGGVALIVLLIACANVANLLLADSVRRRREIAVRSALGIGRGGIMRLFASQSLWLAGAAGVTALVIAAWSGALLRALLFPDIHWSTGVLDWRVAVFTLGITLLAGAVAGLAPALRSGRADVSQTLKSGGREGSVHRSRTRAALVVVQTALSTVLLVGAALFVKSLHAIRGLDLGFDVPRLMFVAVHAAHEGPDQIATVAARLPDLVERLGRVPGVERVALNNMLPMYSFSFNTVLYVNGDTLPEWSDGAPSVSGVSPEYFETVGLRVLRGRGLTAHDVQAGGVAVVNETLARLAWPHGDAIGQCLRVGAASAPCVPIVGIVEDARRAQLIESPVRELYLPLPASGTQAWGAIVVRVPPDRASAVELAARREVAALLPGSTIQVVRMAKMLAPQYRPWELGARLFTIFGLLALVVAAIGVFSTLSHEVGQRRHELGVRAALGAGVADSVRLVVGSGLRLVGIGVAVGIVLALTGGRLIAALLYGVAPRDPGALGAVAGVLLVVAAIASALPAWRASRADPMEALRAD